jgi:hypothetical protein
MAEQPGVSGLPDQREASGWDVRTDATTSSMPALAAAESASSSMSDFMRGGLGDMVGTVGRQRGQMVLRRLPLRAMAGIGGEDDERPTVQR